MEVLALLGIVGFAAWLYRWVFEKYLFYRLEYKCRFSCSEAWEGDDIFLVETVYNNKLLPVHWMKAEIHSSKWLDFADTRSTIAQEHRFVTSGFSLGGFQKTERRWKVKCLKRGFYKTERVTLAGGDFLGISSCSIPVTVNAGLVVFPGILNLRQCLVPARHMQGDTVVRRWIHEDPFMICGTREYTACDSMNRIHWPSTARQGVLMVRKNEFTARPCVRILLNVQSTEYEYLHAMDKDLVELGIRAAAAILDMALREGITVGLSSNGSTSDGGCRTVFSKAASGKAHVADLLTVLAKLELKKVREFEDYLEDVSGFLREEELVMISTYLSEGLCTRIKAFKARGMNCKVILVGECCMRYDLEAEVYFLPKGE